MENQHSTAATSDLREGFDEESKRSVSRLYKI
jgi:hypothetical protein